MYQYLILNYTFLFQNTPFVLVTSLPLECFNQNTIFTFNLSLTHFGYEAMKGGGLRLRSATGAICARDPAIVSVRKTPCLGPKGPMLSFWDVICEFANWGLNFAFMLMKERTSSISIIFLLNKRFCRKNKFKMIRILSFLNYKVYLELDIRSLPYL